MPFTHSLIKMQEKTKTIVVIKKEELPDYIDEAETVSSTTMGIVETKVLKMRNGGTIISIDGSGQEIMLVM